MHTIAREYAAEPTPRGRSYPLQKTILFASPEGRVPHRLRQAIENEMRWAVVAEVPDVDRACASFRDTVSIILVDAAFLDDVERLALDLKRHHPLAPVMLLLDRNGEVPCDVFAQILESRIVRGILPLNSPTDLMISVISMMLRGGEYFPRQWFRPLLTQSRPVATQPARHMPITRHPAFDTLTRREHEILQLVAKGLQNKTIAGALNLSEHTVKIHIHNIISKLGAHNRTQASSMFRDYRETPLTTA